MSNKKENKATYRDSLKEFEEQSTSDSHENKKRHHSRKKHKYSRRDDSIESKDRQQTTLSKNFKQASNKQTYSGFYPANDLDNGGITHILQNIGKNSLNIALRNAFMSSLIWLACELGFLIKFYTNSPMDSFYDFAMRPEVITLFLVVSVVPILLFFSFFIMISRARDMHDASQSIAGIALRLIDPEEYSSEKMQSISSAVRKEIVLMTEEIDRAISRASELEKTVRSEIEVLENNYTKSEMRIDNITQNLKQEREAIINHGTQLCTSIAEVHESLKEELSLTSEEISVHLSRAIDSFQSIVDVRIAKVTEKTTRIVQESAQTISSKIDQLLEVLHSTSIVITKDFDNRIESLSNTLNNSGRSLANQVGNYTLMLGNNTDKVSIALKEQSQQFMQAFTSHICEMSNFFSEKQKSITVTLNDVLQSLRISLQEKEDSFCSNLKSTTDNTLREVDNRTNTLENRITAFLKEIVETFNNSITDFSSFYKDNLSEFESNLQGNIDKLQGCFADSHGNMEDLFLSNIQTIGSNLDKKTLLFEDILSKKQNNISQITSMNTERLENTLTNSINSLKDMLEEKRQRIDSDIGKKSEELCSSFNSSYQKVSNVISDREKLFSNSLARVQSHFEETIAGHPQSIVDSISNSTNNLYDKIMVLAAALSESQKSLDNSLKAHATDVVHIITNAENQLVNRFDESSKNIICSYNSSNNKLETIFQKHLHSFNDTFNNKSDHVSGILKNSTQHIDDLFSNNAKRMEELLHSGSANIESELSAISKAMNKSIDDVETISTALKERCQELGSDLVNHSDKVLSSLKQAQELLCTTFAQRNDSFVNALADNQSKFENNLVNQSHLLLDKLSSDIQKLTDIAYSKAIDVANSLTEIQGNVGVTLENHSQAMLEKISASNTLVAKTFEECMSNILLSYDENRQTLDKKLSDHIDVLRQNLAGSENKIDGAIGSASQFIRDILDENSSRIESLLSCSNNSVNSTLLRSHQKFDRLLQEKSDELIQLLDNKASCLSTAVSTQTINLENNLKEQEKSLSRVVDTSASSFKYLSDSIQTLAQELVSVIGSMSQSTTDISGKLEISLDSVNQKIQKCREFFGDNIVAFMDEISKVMEISEKRISQRTQEISQQLLQNNDVITNQIIDSTSRVRGEIVDISNKFIETSRVLEQREEKFHSALDSFSDNISRILLDVDHTISSHTNESRSLIEQRIHEVKDVLSNLDRALESYGSTVFKQFKEYVQCFETNMENMESLFDKNNDSMLLSFKERSNILDNILSQRSMEISDSISGAFHKEGNAVVNVIDQQIYNAANALKKLEALLISDVEKITNRITDSSQDVTTIISDATDSLNKVDERLHQTTNRITETTGHIDTVLAESSKLFEKKIKDLGEISRVSLLQMSEIVSKFDKNSQILIKSHDSLMKAQSETKLSLDKDANNLVDLTSRLVSKSSEAQKFVMSILVDVKKIVEQADFLSDTVVKNMTDSIQSSFIKIDGTLSNIETRSRDTVRLIDHNLADIGNKTVKTIDSNFVTLKEKSYDLSNHMRQKICSTIPNIENIFSTLEEKSDQSMQVFLDSLNNKVDSFTQKLSKTSDDIALTSRRIAEDLNNSRDILKRDSVSLAKEAKESADTIRSAIEEQINTLKDFQKLITDSVKNNAASYNKGLHSDEYNISQVDKRPSGKKTKNNHAIKEWFNKILSSSTHSKGKSSSHIDISDKDSLSSIDSLVENISKFIDYDAFVQLWKSYTLGEDDIFSKRLYTIKGQKVFLNLQEQYKADSALRNAIDRYISNFEEMLSEIAQSNDDSPLVQEHIMSNYGKVYTMLVHASGRTL
ncbi:chemotaxis protein [Candidatus Liberibacter asiaticus]